MKPVSPCPPECTADSYMDKLPYGARSSEAHRRSRLGDRQTYCAHCKLCRWLEEQRSCRLFSVDHELEAFYAEDARKFEARKKKSTR